jgi:hypothetical protein
VNLYGFVGGRVLTEWDSLGLQSPATPAGAAVLAEVAALEGGAASAADLAACNAARAATRLVVAAERASKLEKTGYELVHASLRKGDKFPTYLLPKKYSEILKIFSEGVKKCATEAEKKLLGDAKIIKKIIEQPGRLSEKF